MANNITIKVGSQNNATPDVAALQKQLVDLGKIAVSAKVDVNDKAAQAQVLQINARIAALNKQIARPNIDLAGVAKAQAEIAALELKLDKVGDHGDQAGSTFAQKFLGYVLPGKKTSIITGAGIALAALPALAGVQGVAMGTEMMFSLTSSILEQNKTVKTAFKGIGDSINSTLQDAIKPLVPIIDGVGNQVAGFIKKIEPQLQGLFKSIGPSIAPIVKSVEGIAQPVIGFLKSVVPAMQPFISGLMSLVKNLLPGFTGLIKDVAPFIGQFGKMLGSIGSALGSAFKDFGAVIKPSMDVLGDLFKVITTLLPVVTHLAGVFAKALAPVLGGLGGIVKDLTPTINALGKILASLAGAVLTSLSGALQAVGQVLKGIAPSFSDLVKVLGQVFNLMENSGVFGVLEDALEKLAQPLANFINALIKGLLPVMPQLIQIITQFSNILITLLSAGLVTVLNAVTSVINKFPAIVPIIAAIVLGMKAWGVVNTALAGTMRLLGVATAETAGEIEGMTVVEKLQAITEGVVALATKAWAAVQLALNAAMDINPFVAIGVALVALVAVIIKYHKQILDVIETAWNNVKDFLKQWWPLVLGIVTGGIGLVIGVIVKYHNQIFDAIKSAWNKVLNAIKSVWGDILSFAKSWWPLLLGPSGVILKYHTQIESGIKAAWNAIKSFLTGLWNGLSSAAKTAFNAIAGVVKSAFNDDATLIKTVWNNIMSFLKNVWGDMKSGFSGAVSGIKTAWNKLEDIFKSPVSFLINTVYDNGIARLWNDVMGKIGGPTLPIIKGFAEGGRLPGYGGGDRNLALLEDGETVVPKHLTNRFAPMFKAAGIPGFAAGGLVGEAASIGKMMVAGATGNETAFSNAFSSAVSPLFGGGGSHGDLGKMMVGIPTHLVSDVVAKTWDKIKDLFGGGPTAQAIVKYAESFVGKVPYLWGGTTTSGWDCSGFSGFVYKHAGYNSIPRTSQQQALWVQRSPSPQMGGLAFYTGSDGTSSAPGHVGILTGHGNQIVDALGTGLGTRIDNLGTPLWTGVPPNGFKGNPPMGHHAGGAVASGLAMVGEYGRELVNLPGGSSVIPHGQTESMMSSGCNHAVTLEINTSGQPIDEALLQILRKSIRVRGGNVQTALGH